MAARTLGWAQTINALAGPRSGALNAATDTTVVPNAMLASLPTASNRVDSQVFLVAGTAYNIRWGGLDPVGACWGAGTAANTAAWRCDVMYETTQTSAASDSVSIAGTSGGSVDRTFAFTPTVTGTYRLKVNIIVTVTVGGAALTNDNTDNGNFGSATPVRLAGNSNDSFTPGLIVAGCNLSAPTRTPTPPFYFTDPRTTIVNSFPFSVGSQGTDASETCTVSWRNAAETQFNTTTINATTSATKAGPGLAVNNSNFPYGSTSVGLRLSFNNSILSTSLSGAGIPWTFITTAGIPAGWSAVTSNSIGATTIKAAGLYIVDNRLYPTSGDMADWTALRGVLFQQQTQGISFFDPPSSGDVVSGQRVFPDTGFIAVRYINAAGVGINGLVTTLKGWDAGSIGSSESTPFHTFSGTTATRRNAAPNATPEIGWLPAAAAGSDRDKCPIVWSTVFSGTWRWKSVITGPADATGLEHYPLNSGADFWNRNLFLITPQPNFQPLCKVQFLDSTLEGRHMEGGDSLFIEMWMKNNTNTPPVSAPLVNMVPANGDAAYVAVTDSSVGNGRMRYLDPADNTLKAKANSAHVFAYTMIPASTFVAGGDPDIFVVAISGIIGSVAARDLSIEPIIVKDGVPYPAQVVREVLGTQNKHDAAPYGMKIGPFFDRK